ncbi:unnamed protein product [Eruca vesicaria subsp. sativa]|uniref:RING-CH-type domain-containing protein n=1 Tax=Eruca vesicaria subsp. sativa TaxID=29727 RepID=A0ABC8L6V7_ERUVS|nr:unnamed protein product [Eruca vesicaria subsp. sativa]
MNEMDQKSCTKSTIVCESSSGSVPDVKGETSDAVSNHVLSEKQKENDSRTGEDGVGCSNVSPHTVHEEVANNVTHESDASTKAKAKEFHVIDLSGGGESDNGQRICRICHFGSDQTPDRVSGKSVSIDLIEIGCKCKNELGLAHFHCAEAWFKLKGNSVCEICGSSALNVPVRLTEEEWSEIRDTTVDEGRRRGSGRSCCIFMVFLLGIILLHWFFKKMSVYYQSKLN